MTSQLLHNQNIGWKLDMDFYETLEGRSAVNISEFGVTLQYPALKRRCLYQLIRDTGQALTTWTRVRYKCLAIAHLPLDTGHFSEKDCKQFTKLPSSPTCLVRWVNFLRWDVESFFTLPFLKPYPFHDTGHFSEMGRWELVTLLKPYPSRETGYVLRWVSH